MDWNRNFASRTGTMRLNTVREFLKFARRPGMISFGGGLPAPELFPICEFQTACHAVLEKHGSKSLQYGQTEGVPELREYIAEQEGVSVENVLITSGAQQGLDLLGRVLIDRNDWIAVENPTYLALLSSWQMYEPRFHPVPSDESGLDVSQLPQHAKLLYVVPNFQNPQGTTLAEPRRQTLADLSRKNGTLVVEDDPYGELRYEGERLTSVFEFAGECNGPVVRTGTFSKILAPGLRVGWTIGHSDLIHKLVQAKQSADLHTSTFSQYVALELAASGLLKTHIPKLRTEYRTRRDAMLSALSEWMPSGTSWNRPAGGMFLLLRLPEGILGSDIATNALAENVLVVPGEDFHLSGGTNTLRLNFSNCAPETIRTGIERLARIIARSNPKAPGTKDNPK